MARFLSLCYLDCLLRHGTHEILREFDLAALEIMCTILNFGCLGQCFSLSVCLPVSFFLLLFLTRFILAFFSRFVYFLSLAPSLYLSLSYSFFLSISLSLFCSFSPFPHFQPISPSHLAALSISQRIITRRSTTITFDPIKLLIQNPDLRR